jgi:hypothetical protein
MAFSALPVFWRTAVLMHTIISEWRPAIGGFRAAVRGKITRTSARLVLFALEVNAAILKR